MKYLFAILFLIAYVLPSRAGLDWYCKPDSAIEILNKEPDTTVYPCVAVSLGVTAQDLDQWYYPNGEKVPPPQGPHCDELIYTWTSPASRICESRQPALYY